MYYMMSLYRKNFWLLFLTYWFWHSSQFTEMSAWIAIFLFWILFLKNGFLAFSWGLLESILQKSTDKYYKSLLFWFFASSILQSSTLVTVITISFLSAELITLVQWIWIIFWSSVWTTTTAWLVAWIWMKVNLWAYAMPLLVFWMIFTFQKSKSLNWLWSILAWLWFIFLWIHFMKLWFESFQSVFSLRDYSMPWYYWFLTFVLLSFLFDKLLIIAMYLLNRGFSLCMNYEKKGGILRK